VGLSSATLAGMLAANAVTAAPVGLGAATAASALSTPVATSFLITATGTSIMTTLKSAFITLGVAAGIGVGWYQARQANQLRAKILELEASQPANGSLAQGLNLSPVTAPPQSGAESNRAKDLELLRLRGEVTRLRNQADILAADAKAAMTFQAEMLQALSNTPPIRTLASTAVATATWNQPILTGGWKTPSGKRAIVVTTPMSNGVLGQLAIKSQLLEYTEEAGAILGLDEFNTEEQAASKASQLSAQQWDTILKAASAHEGVDVITAPMVTTLSGRQAQIQVVDLHQTPSGEKYTTGPVLDIIPTINPDGESVHLVLASHLNYPILTLPPDKTPNPNGKE